MFRHVSSLLIAAWLVAACAGEAFAVRVMTSPSTGVADPPLQFQNIALTPDGSTVVATANLDAFTTGDRVYSLPIPADPATQTATATQLSTNSFLVNDYDVAFPPVISPDGQTILFSHDGNSLAPPTNAIYTMPITGEGSASSFTGLFGGDPNLVSPGSGNATPIYSPDGSTIFFLNSEAGFGGTIPDFDNPSSPNPWADAPDWDLLYSVPAGGGTPTAVTSADDGDMDVGLFAVTPDGNSIVYAPDNPIAERKDRGDVRPKLFTLPATGGAPSEIPISAPGHDFTINNQLAVTSDGQSVVFISDYETLGKNELFSVPIGGGTPTRISDDLPFAGDVYSFALAPNGAQVAYSAGQNTSSNSELFLTPVTGGVGNSIRVSEPAPSNSGLFDMSVSSEGGQILFSPDSSKIYYLGDLDTEDVIDLYVVDTTEKTGLVPTAFTFVGSTSNEFFDESNWEDPDGNTPPIDTINPNTPIRHSLIIDGDEVVASGAPQDEVSFQLGGSLEMTPGSTFSSSLLQLEFNPGSGLKLTDATIKFAEDVILSGTNVLNGGRIESEGDDVEFQDNHKSVVNGTEFVSGDNVVFDQSATSIADATIISVDRLSLRYEIEVTVLDTTIDVNGGLGDVEDIFTGAQGEGSVLTLEGSSTLLADSIEEGVDLVLDGTSVATLRGGTADTHLVDPGGDSTITLMSTGAELVISNPSTFDSRAFVINGQTDMTYLDDPSAWNITNWDGLAPLASLKLVATGLLGDFDDDGDVDGADFLLWQRGGSPNPLSGSDLSDWQANFGDTAPLAASTTSVPEPAGMALLAFALVIHSLSRGRDRRGMTEH